MSSSTALQSTGPLGDILSAIWRGINSGPARWLVVVVPMVWLVAFLLLPLIEVFQISFSTHTRTVQPLFYWNENGLGTNFNLNAYVGLVYDPVFQEFSPSFFGVPVLKSLRLASVSTLLMLCFAYPMAYWIAVSRPRTRLILLILVLLPFWTPSLLRIYSLFGLMNQGGLINSLLLNIGVIEEPLRLKRTHFAVYAGMYITYLPLMILPLYAALTRMDLSLNEAAADLGASALTIFRTITLPLSMPGVIAGCILVFVPAFGEVLVPDLLGGPDHGTLGRKIWESYRVSRDYPGLSAITVVLMTCLVLPVVMYQLRQDDSVKKGDA